MSVVRLGAVGYLNARPHVYGLDRDPRFTVRFDAPSQCAELLHDRSVDLGLIPSIEYQRGEYAVVPGVAIASRGPVASVAIYTSKPIEEVRSIALDTSSRTSVALVRILCARQFKIAPALERHRPDLPSMLAAHDAALIIGDHALFIDPGEATKIDLGEAWTRETGLPFVYAFWAGRLGALDGAAVSRLQLARDEGMQHIEEITRDYFPGDASRQATGARYLRDNIKYDLGEDERAGLERFYAYAAEAGVIPTAQPLRFYRPL